MIAPPSLRRIRSTDLESLYVHHADPRAVALIGRPPLARERFLQRWSELVDHDGTVRARAIVRDELLIGSVFAWRDETSLWVGYAMGFEYWGQGFATWALGAFLRDHETARPVRAHVATRNVGSIRVLEKSGFRRVGDVEIDEYANEEWTYELDL